jgi:precorrin-2 dehydrogenase/sirohydrochlorin ferrochelatase
MNLFPIFLKLAGRRCLVVGASPVGESKVKSLLLAGAEVLVVAPRATPAIRAWARDRKVCWKARGFCPSDLNGASLVVAATSSPELQEKIFQEARRRGALCNVVDNPARCDFYYPAIVRRGDLQIAISTSGRSPAFAQQLKQELEKRFGPEYETWIERLGQAREKVLARAIAPQRRRRLLHRLASRGAFEAFLRQRQGADFRQKQL